MRARCPIESPVRADDTIASACEVETLTILAVIARIVANPLSNLFQKQLAQRSADPLFTIVATHGLLTALALPLLAGTPLGTLSADFWTDIVTAVVLAVAGYLFLWYALRSADLSVLGPINAYKAVLGLLLAVVLIGEVPTVFGLIGVALIVAGSYFVIDRVPGQAHRHAFRQFAREPGVRLRFAALICSATESVFLKRALILSSPITTFLVWTVFCFALAVMAALLFRRGVAAEVTRLRTEWRTLSLAGRHHRVDAADDPADIRQVAGRLLTRTLPALDTHYRVSRSSLLPGAQHPAPSARLFDHGDRGGLDRDARPSRLMHELGAVIEVIPYSGDGRK